MNKQDYEWFGKTDIDEVDAQAVAEQIKSIGEWYDKKQTIINDRTLYAWVSLAKESKVQAKRLRALYGVTVLYVAGQPYTLPVEMFNDIRGGVLKISVENWEHPIFSFEDTMNQRIWHDLTHFEQKTNFGFSGEVNTCNAQIEHLVGHPDKDAIAYALYIDIVGQVANGLIHKQFPVQKVF